MDWLDVELWHLTFSRSGLGQESRLLQPVMQSPSLSRRESDIYLS